MCANGAAGSAELRLTLFHIVIAPRAPGSISQQRSSQWNGPSDQENPHDARGLELDGSEKFSNETFIAIPGSGSFDCNCVYTTVMLAN